MDVVDQLLSQISSFVWGPFLLIPLLLGAGLYLTVRLGGMQFFKLGVALRLGLLKRRDPDCSGDVSQYQALTTALAATVRSEEHTSELQSRGHLVCRLL